MGELEADSQQLAVVSKKDSRQDGASCCLLRLRKVLPHPSHHTFPPFFIFILVHIVLSSSCTLIFSLVHTFSSDLDQQFLCPKPALLDIAVEKSYFLIVGITHHTRVFRTFGLDNFSVHHHACLSR